MVRSILLSSNDGFLWRGTLFYSEISDYSQKIFSSCHCGYLGFALFFPTLGFVQILFVLCTQGYLLLMLGGQRCSGNQTQMSSHSLGKRLFATLSLWLLPSDYFSSNYFSTHHLLSHSFLGFSYILMIEA